MAQLLRNLPIGAKVKFGKHSINGEAAQDIVWLVVAKNHKGYPSDSVTLLTQKIIDLRPLDASEPSNSDTSRYNYGNNTYGKSNLDQWLNSSEYSWYAPTHTYDQAPDNGHVTNKTGYDTRPGFLTNFTTKEIAVIVQTSLTAPAYYNTTESIVRGIFLPSLEEVDIVTTEDNSSWGYFKDKLDRRAIMTSQCYTNTLGTSKPDTESSYWSWWLRSAGVFSSHLMATVKTTGDVVTEQMPKAGDIGVRPALNIDGTQKVSDVTDSDGCYTMVWNDPPVIDGNDENLGVKSEGFAGTYTVTDANSDTVTVSEAIDGIRIRSLIATLGEKITYGVTENTWLALSNGSHTLTISATDGIDTTVRTLVFTKLVETFKIQNATPWAASTMPSRIMLVITRNIPFAATFKVEVCNNGYDTSPTWEDCTDAVKSGMVHVFTNKTKTATNWGVLVRVTVARNGATGACYVSAIGGNFE